MRLLLLLLAVVLAVAILYSGRLRAEPIAIAQGKEVTVILTDEPCALDAVANLPRRATWGEKGRTFEGCYGIVGGLVVAYFSDRSVVVVPGNAFTRPERT